MRRQYPHLSTDAFPHIENVHPYRRKVTFDYERYDYTSLVKLCRVPWPMDYRHVVNWRDETQRDRYFDELSGRVIELASGFVRTQTDRVRIDVPYDEALTYSYIYMRVPQLTEDEPIRHEGEDGLRVVCAWIREAIYFAPSATELILSVDYWTTYLPHLAPVTMMLHRGHAPAYALSADEYLSNPKENNSLLLTQDVNFGVHDVCAHTELIDIAQGEKMIVLASTIPLSAVEGLTRAIQQNTSESTPPVYYDTGLRNGQQVGVDAYEWHYGGYTYDGLRNPSAYTSTGGGMPVYTTLYAMRSVDAAALLKALSERLPQFIQSVQAAYILPRRALVLSDRTYSAGGVQLFAVEPTPMISDIADVRLTREMFDYPARYADIAKLYTSPYAHMVVSDTLGNEIELRIEDVGSEIRLMEQVSPMFECLRWDVLIEGVNDSGCNGYVWQTLTGNDLTLYMPGTDVARYTLMLGIPTYALMLDGRINHAAHDYYDAQSRREAAIASYQGTMRSANNASANAIDSANTGQANANASADTSVTNTANQGACSTSNAAIANNLRTVSTARYNTMAENDKDISVQNIFDALYLDDEYTMQASDVNLKSESVAGALSTIGALASGNIVGAVSNGVSAVVNVTTSAALSLLSSENIEGKEAVGQDYQRKVTAQHQANATDQAGYQNAANTNTTANNVSTANTNASNSASTAKANAARTSSTSKLNAGYDRSTTETNAKQALELARHTYDRQGHAHDLDSPVAFGAVTGDHTADALMRRIIQVRVETQSKGAIARAGDAMLRFGYIFDGLWEVSDWCPDDHMGCYWEATDLLLNADAITNTEAELTFESILTNGVTVWNDPSQIGGLPW